MKVNSLEPASPDTLEITLGELSVAEFPCDDAWDVLRVHFADDVHEAILKHAQESDKLELCVTKRV